MMLNYQIIFISYLIFQKVLKRLPKTGPTVRIISFRFLALYLKPDTNLKSCYSENPHFNMQIQLQELLLEK